MSFDPASMNNKESINFHSIFSKINGDTFQTNVTKIASESTN